MRISPLFLHVFCLLAADPAFAQKNILRNGGFEEHGEQKCLSCIQSSGQYAGLVYHWDNGGWHGMLCDHDPVALGARPLMDAQMLFYENDAFALTAEHRAALDTFAGYANRYPDLVFELSGHTDSIGADNLALSQKRVQAVYEYLTGTLQLPAHRLIALARGSATPFRPNYTEEGRKMNRRTEIRQSDITLPMMYYRYALKALHENNKAGAFACLDKWVAKAEKGSLPLLLFDPRFDPLRPDKRWPLIEKKVRDSYQNHKYATASFLLDSIRLDACRLSGEALADMLNTLPGHIPGGDNYAIALPGATEEAVAQRYRAHYHSICKML